MTEVISTILGATQLGSIALIAWLVIKIVSAEQTAADARVAQVTTEEHLTTAQLELDQTKAALASRDVALDKLSHEYSDLLSKWSPNADLPASDLHDRVSRLFTLLSPTAGAGGNAGPAPALPPHAAADGPEAGSTGG